MIAQDGAGQNWLMGSAIRSAKFSASDGSGTGSTTDGRRGLGMEALYPVPPFA